MSAFQLGDIIIDHKASDKGANKVMVFLRAEDRFFHCLTMDGRIVETLSLFHRFEKIGELDLTDWIAASEAIRGRAAEKG